MKKKAVVGAEFFLGSAVDVELILVAERELPAAAQHFFQLQIEDIQLIFEPAVPKCAEPAA